VKNIVIVLIYSGWYISMAIGGCLACAAVGYLHYSLFGLFLKSHDSLIVPIELTAAMMSGILLFGRIYCKYLNCDNASDMRRFMNWRIQLLHIITIIAIIIDVVS
jgi:hypothetical protein